MRVDHPALGLRLETPGAFSVVEESERGLVLHADGGRASVAVTVVPVGPGAELDALVERGLAARGRAPGSMRVIDRQRDQIGGFPAVHTTCSQEVGGDLLTIAEWRVLAGDRLAMVAASCPTAVYDRHADAFDGIAASLTLEGPQEPAPAGPRFDPSTGLLLVGDVEFDVLCAAAAGESAGDDANDPVRRALAAAGALVSGRPHPALSDGVRPAVEPVLELTVTRNRADARAWLGEDDACLLLPAGAGLRRLVVAPAQRLPELLADVVGLGPRPADREREVLTFDVPALAQLVAERLDGLRTDGGPLEGLSAHWRVEARRPGEEGGEMVEVLDTSHGLWLVVPTGRSVELRPTAAAGVWRELTQLLARRP